MPKTDREAPNALDGVEQRAAFLMRERVSELVAEEVDVAP